MRLMRSKAAAEYAKGGIASSHFAVPSRRSGPWGDPPPPVAKKPSMAVSQLPASPGRKPQRPQPHDPWTSPGGHGYPDSEGMISPSEYTLIEPSDCPKNQDHFKAWHKDVGTAVVTGAVAGGTGFGLVKLAQKAIKVVKAYRAARAAGKGAITVRKGAEAVDGATFPRTSGGGSAIPKSVDDLLQRAVESKPLARPGWSQVTVKGNNPNEIFKSLTRNAEKTPKGGVRLKDGTVLHLHPSSTTGVQTIQVQRGKKFVKIRFEQE